MKKRSLLFVLVPPLLYILFRAIVPDQYRIIQEVPVRQDAPLVQASPAAPARTVADLLSSPAILFEDQIGLM
jgi:hypothetical protein